MSKLIDVFHRSLERILFIPDCHRPFHDRRAYQLMITAAKHFRPHIIVVLGDYADCWSISFHAKEAGRSGNLKDEIGDVYSGIKELSELGAVRKYYIEGNHEHRLERYINTQARDLYGLISIPELLDLEKFGWKYIPYRDFVTVGKILCTHDLGFAGKYALNQSHASMGERNMVIGHTHRMEYKVVGDIEGRPWVAASFGWLGSVAKAALSYKHRARANREWVHGFGVGYKNGLGHVHMRPVPIIKGSCVIGDRLITL